jgi:hypothetical protein
MIVCDDHFLNDESMLKAMLRVFDSRIIRILRLRSISWIALSFSFRRKARDVCVYMCVCVCLCVREKMRIRSVVCEKSLSFVEFRDFCLLKSILELITRSLVNIKREEKKFTSLIKFTSSNLHLRFITSYEKFILFAVILAQISDYSILF